MSWIFFLLSTLVDGISHDRGGHLFPFLHKNLDLKYKTWLGGRTLFYIDIPHGNSIQIPESKFTP